MKNRWSPPLKKRKQLRNNAICREQLNWRYHVASIGVEAARVLICRVTIVGLRGAAPCLCISSALCLFCSLSAQLATPVLCVKQPCCCSIYPFTADPIHQTSNGFRLAATTIGPEGSWNDRLSCPSSWEPSTHELDCCPELQEQKRDEAAEHG